MYNERQVDTPVYPQYSTHYPNHYGPSTSLVPAQNNNFFPQQHQLPTDHPPNLSLPPVEPAVTPDVASKAIRKLVSAELQYTGFQTAAPGTLERLEVEVDAFIRQLFQRAHEYANHSNRTGAIPSDLICACEEYDIHTADLYAVTKRSSKKRRRSYNPIQFSPSKLIPPHSRSPSPTLLGSDDEDAPPVVPPTLRGLPSYLPSLPPKHTYLQTPVSPPKKAALPSLEKKLKTASLVQESLQNLLLATEDVTDQEDGELLGHIVNWEMGLYPRKRWKIS